jgi:hypothetical protein
VPTALCNYKGEYGTSPQCQIDTPRADSQHCEQWSVSPVQPDQLCAASITEYNIQSECVLRESVLCRM